MAHQVRRKRCVSFPRAIELSKFANRADLGINECRQLYVQGSPAAEETVQHSTTQTGASGDCQGPGCLASFRICSLYQQEVSVRMKVHGSQSALRTCKGPQQ
jgi:hypothetical protein